MADVFISYHRTEGTSALARRIADELESKGISCWYDAKDLTPVWFVHAIQTEIQRCKVFLLILDENSNKSEWCLAETYAAFESANHPVLIPFKIGAFQENDEMRFYMRTLPSSYGGDSPENADIQALTAKIANVLRTKSASTKSNRISKGTMSEMNAPT